MGECVGGEGSLGHQQESSGQRSDSDSELGSKSSSQMCVVAVSVFSPQNLVKFTFL